MTRSKMNGLKFLRKYKMTLIHPVCSSKDANLLFKRLYT